LWLKRLEKGRFKWPIFIGEERVTPTGRQLNSIDLRYVLPEKMGWKWSERNIF
jgi:hypothetical protein